MTMKIMTTLLTGYSLPAVMLGALHLLLLLILLTAILGKNTIIFVLQMRRQRLQKLNALSKVTWRQNHNLGWSAQSQYFSSLSLFLFLTFYLEIILNLQKVTKKKYKERYMLYSDLPVNILPYF